MKSKTFNLFIISAIILMGTLLAATFWDTLELGPNKTPLALSMTIAFGVSIAGLVVGFGEIRTIKTSKMWIGLVGHFIVGLFAVTVVYAMMLVETTK